MTPLETYLRELRDIRSSGASLPEPSYYPALSNLLNEVGKSLNPKIHCIMSIANRGAGFPDGGLFTPDQLRKASEAEPLIGQVPARGVIEVKGTGDDARVTAEGEQVSRYLRLYGQVLVTNLREFILVGRDAKGKLAILERYQLAESESAFWDAAVTPTKMAQKHSERFHEYLRRVFLHAAPLAAPEEVARFLSSYAREANARLEAGELPALAAVRAALEEALGLKFEGEKGEHFFRSTLVQTLFYGVFSAWVLWRKDRPTTDDAQFNWQLAGWYLRVPMIKALFERIATPTTLKALGLVEVLDWTEAVLNRVDRDSFFGKFEEGHAVQYFYEPFLKAFDPELQKDLGVWYTPPEIIQYMVARVDTVLRDEFGLPDGLADPNVYVLDPCCGTGGYLVEVLKRINETLEAKSGDALVPSDVKRAAIERIFGFEILPAPFVVAHLQLGLLLQNLGAPLSEEPGERAGVYLTNSLTGWEPLDPEKEKAFQAILTGFPELVDERDQSRMVKQEVPILVILGNPPYSVIAGVAMGEERELTKVYREAKATRQPQGPGINDLYVRFFRMAERRITEQTGRGIVCFISNYSWLDSLSCPAMRERYLDKFDGIWIDCLNGDKFKTGKLTPDGKPDPSIFSTEWNPEGIQVGTAIGLLVRNDEHTNTSTIRFRHLWGKEKRAELLATAIQDGVSLYEEIAPPIELGFPFMPLQAEAGYFTWPLLPDLFPVSFPGVKTSRDAVVVDIDYDPLLRRMEQYFDHAISHEELRHIAPDATKSTPRFEADAIRDQLRQRGFLRDHIVRYSYRPFDVRWLYWEPKTKLLDEKRAAYFPHVFEDNQFIVSQQKPRRAWSRPQLIRRIGCLDLMDRGASVFPLYLMLRVDETSGQGSGEPHPNLSNSAAVYLRNLNLPADELFSHTLAILHSPSFEDAHTGALCQDWPRVPLPLSSEALRASASLGRNVAALLDTEHPIVGVTTGRIRTELNIVAVATRVGGGSLDPDTGDLALTVGWGHAGKGGASMPGKGQVVERDYTPEERAAIKNCAKALGLSEDEVSACLGESTRDVYLNERAYWKNIPTKVWEYTIGGYQVIKKWLSYREHALLGRALTSEEVREVTHMARRVAAITLIEPALDANYEAVKAATYEWAAVP